MELSLQGANNSALDLVEEFRLLDEIADQGNMENRRLGDSSGAHYNGCSPERSIGGADLSDILALEDEDDDFVEFAVDITNNADGHDDDEDGDDDDDDDDDPSSVVGKASNATTAATAVTSSTLQSSGSVWKEAAGNCLARSDDPVLQQEAGHDGAWDSEDDCGEAGAKKAGGGGDGAVSGEGAGGLGTLSETNNNQCAVGGSPALDDCSNPNVSGPTRPAEEGSDWDGASSRSSNDVDSECSRSRVNANRESHWSGTSGDERIATKTFPLPSPSTTGVTSPLSELGEEKLVIVGTASETARSSSGGVSVHYQAGTRRAQPDQRASKLRHQGERHSGKLHASKVADGDAGRRESDNGERYGALVGGSGGGLAETAAAAAAAAAAEDTIEMLQAELRRLKEHVLRSEQRREEQLRELDSRLEVQEKRNGPPIGRAHAAERVAFEVPEEENVALVVDRADEARRPRGKGGSDTPKAPAVHNPFAATGGTATPRDHFPAFEDALHDGGEGGVVQGAGGREDEEANKSLLQIEAFDFSIDTLSHINNHTDFGTEAPVVTPAGRTVAAYTNANGESKGGGGGGAGKRESARKPWPLVQRSAPGISPGLQVGQEAEEVFDAKDTAAEEAFFADAFATASLQTPVKHVHGTGAGFAVRRVRPDGRPARGTPAERAGTLLSPKVMESQQGLRNALPGRPPPIVGVSGQPCSARRESSLPGSPELCMADFFARASAELGDSEDEGGGAAVASPIHAIGGRNSPVLRPAVERARPRGVDAASQTTWSFSAREGVRFVLTPLKTPLRTLMADGRDTRHRTDRADWRVGSGCDEKAGMPPPAGVGEVRSRDGKADGRDGMMDLHAHPYDDRAPCCTPRRSSQPLWQTPGRISQKDRDEAVLAGVGSISERSTLFNSLTTLSPIGDARQRPQPAATCGVDEFDEGRVYGRAADGGGGGKGSVREQEGGEAARIGGRRRRRSASGHGLSPILSEGGGSGASVSGEAYRTFATRESASSAGGTTVLSEVGSNTDTGGRVVKDRGRVSRQGDGGCELSREADKEARQSARYREGAQVAKPASSQTPLDAPLFMDSSVDVTRSSLLRSSATLDTIAPLDVTGRSLSFHSRASCSFPGELFADSRLPTCSATAPSRRYEDLPSQRGHARRGDGAACTPSQRRQVSQHRAMSAPTLPSEGSVDSRVRAERLSGHGAQASSLGSRGIPPHVVGAWLAAAIDGIYGHNASGADDGSLLDQRTTGNGGTSSCGRDGFPAADPVPVDLNPAVVRSPLVDVCGRRDNPTSLFTGVRATGIENKGTRYDYARAFDTPSRLADYGDDSPPPPPPPPPLPSALLHLGLEDEVGSNDGEAANEEELFYQRQRLLQRVFSAAASHGGLPTARGSLASLVGGYASEGGQGRAGEVVDTMHGDSRRHSDPLSWKTPVMASAAGAGGVAGGSEASARARATMNTPSHLRRQTSGYWRDRLGMTQ